MHLSSRICSKECTKAHTLLIAAHSLQGAALGLQSRRILSFLINCVIHTKETLFTQFIPPPTGLRTAFDRIMFSSHGHVLHEDLLSFSSIARIDIFYLSSKRSLSPDSSPHSLFAAAFYIGRHDHLQILDVATDQSLALKRSLYSKLPKTG
jgi:hypothetical protein